MTDARDHNIKKMKKRKRKMIRGEGKYPLDTSCALN
jgi:hypothetical protein